MKEPSSPPDEPPTGLPDNAFVRGLRWFAVLFLGVVTIVIGAYGVFPLLFLLSELVAPEPREPTEAFWAPVLGMLGFSLFALTISTIVGWFGLFVVRPRTGPIGTPSPAWLGPESRHPATGILRIIACAALVVMALFGISIGIFGIGAEITTAHGGASARQGPPDPVARRALRGAMYGVVILVFVIVAWFAWAVVRPGRDEGAVTSGEQEGEPREDSPARHRLKADQRTADG